MRSLKQQLLAMLRAVEHLEEGEGVFHPDQPGFFVDGRLVVEFVDNNSVGVRLTQPRIRIREVELASDPRVEPLRPGGDWVAIHFRRAADLPGVVELAADAVGAYVPADGTRERGGLLMGTSTNSSRGLGRAPEAASAVRPLPALLSQLLVAFTVEFDNTFERRMRDGGHKGFLSLAFWLAYGRHLRAGMTVGEFTAVTSLSRRDASYLLAVLERWRHLDVRDIGAPTGRQRPGYGTIQPIPARFIVWPTSQLERALELWPCIASEVEDRWVTRFGATAVARLRGQLEAIVEAQAAGLPWGLPDCAMGWALGRLPPPTEPLPRDGEDRPLAALISQVLWKFACDYNHESDVPIAIGASLLRVLDQEGARPADLALRSGVDATLSRALIRRSGLFEVASIDRSRLIRLTPLGLAERDFYWRLVDEIQARWDAAELTDALLQLVARQDLIAQGMEPPAGVPRAGDDASELWVNGPSSVRSAVRQLVRQTDAFIDSPSRALPHYPIWSGGRGFGP